MTPDQYGRTGREWRFCTVCQRADALRMRKVDGKPVIQCAYCTPLAKPVAPAPQGIFA